MNIVELIIKLLSSGDTISKLASMLGVGQEQATKAVGAAVPTILASLVGTASKPGGGAEIANALTHQDQGVLNNVSSLFSNGGAASSQGSNLLSSLLGGGNLGQVTSVLSKFTGVGEGGIGKLVGLLAPIILGMIGKQSKGLGATGIADMLIEQRQNIASSLPSGLGNLLSSALPSLGVVVGNASSAARSAASMAGSAAEEVEEAGSSVMKWVVPVLLLAAALFFLPRMCTNVADKAQAVKEKAETTIATATDSAGLISNATGLIKSATETFASITDEASAAAALPKLKDITTKVGSLNGLMATLPESTRRTIGETLRPLIVKLQQTVQPVLASPVGGKVKSSVGEMFDQLDRLAPGQ